eukprot:TRINITY_DN59895_c0_g1_i2.p1 TRINITY_DN59895_c0_g1~~TRINITY_DN59895_c0_g1_i2.p1  ORF type:complete len:860 (+),score=139.38 TRINITY_DN59895_c0_g1_i2:68-2647(+)
MTFLIKGLTAFAVAVLAISVGYFLALNDPSSVRAVEETDAGGSSTVSGASHAGRWLFAAMAWDVLGFSVPIGIGRAILSAHPTETWFSRCTSGAFVASAALLNRRLRLENACNHYGLFFAVQLASYLLAVKELRWVECLLYLCFGAGCICSAEVLGFYWLTCCVCIGVVGTYGLYKVGEHLAPTGNSTSRWARTVVLFGLSILAGVPLLDRAARHLFPVDELVDVYTLLQDIVGAGTFTPMATELMILTLNVQVPLGFLGIWFLRQAQDRGLQLLRVDGADGGKIGAQQFCKVAGKYVLIVAVPYMLLRTSLETVNSYAVGRFANEVARSLRLEQFFPASEGSTTIQSALAVVKSTDFTVASYVDDLNYLAEEAVYTIERKAFSLPKLALLPGMLLAKPSLMLTVLPVSILLDGVKAQLASLLTASIEELSQEMQELTSRRERMEQHDTKNAVLIQRSSVGALTKSRWRYLSRLLEQKHLRMQSLQSLRGFVEWLYAKDMLTPGLECALAFMLELQHIASVDLWVYLRAIEDSIDLLLTRSRSAAQLASMKTRADRLKDLQAKLRRAREEDRQALDKGCLVDGAGLALQIEKLNYTRGSVQVTIPQMRIPVGRSIVVTGANACGKSTALELLAACAGGHSSLPAGIALDPDFRIVLPSDDVVEITQMLYCPLYVTPSSWLLHARDGATRLGDGRRGELWRAEWSGEENETNATAPRDGEERIVELSEKLRFFGGATGGSMSDSHVGGGLGLTLEELRQEREDWYSELSGGQKIKVELIRKVFLRQNCPQVLLLDEVFAPLDPLSKSAVQSMLKEFCPSSLILVIYHSDSGDTCALDGGFFDENLHFENGTASLRPLCQQ